MRIARFAFALGLAVATHATRARAEPTAADRETVRALLAEGDRLFADKDFAGALRAYQGATALIGVPTTAIEVARTQEALGQLVEARDGYLSVARMPSAPSEPAPFGLARVEAADLAERVAKRIPSIIIVPTGVSSSAIPVMKVDGVAIPAAAARLPRKVNPGTHAIVVAATGYKESTLAVTVAEAETRSVETPLEALPVAPAAEPIARPPPPTPTLAIASGVACVVGLGVGAVFGAMSLSRTSSARSHCVGDHCTVDARSDIDTGLTFANVSNVGFGVAIIAGGLALYAILTRPPATSTSLRRGAFVTF